MVFAVLGYVGLFLFLFVPLWYNGFYTYLKQHSAFAVLPGGLLGVIPPAIGWLSAGHTLIEPEFLALALLFFFWQVPHFWLLMAKHEQEYRVAGFPTAVEVFGLLGFRRVLFVWWMLTIVCGVYATIVFSIDSMYVLALLLVLNLYTVFSGVQILFETLSASKARVLFHKINFFLLATVILLSIGRVLHPIS